MLRIQLWGKFGIATTIQQVYKNDELSDTIFIICKDGKWSIHSNKCTNKTVTKRNSKRVDKTACQKCFMVKCTVINCQ